MLNLTTLAALLALAAIPSAAHAEFTAAYQDRRSFLEALQTAGFDSLDDLQTSTRIDTPLHRNAGPYVYSASSPNGLYATAGQYRPDGMAFAGGSALQPWAAHADLLLDGFSSSVYAIGLQVYGAQGPGAYVGDALRMAVTDSSGDTITVYSEFEIYNTGDSPNFFGLVFDSPIVSARIWLNHVGTATPTSFPTVDNLILGTVSAVPEPATTALLSAGLLLIAVRRQHLS